MNLLSLARDLRRRKARERQSLFVVEGVRAVEELLRSALAIRGALVAPQLAEAPRGATLTAALTERSVAVQSVDHREFASAAETESPQGILAIAEVPARTLENLPAGDGALIILDGVQDPGNAGAILRTAAALGARGTVSLPGTVDLWNAKVIRAAMGAHFSHYAFDSTWDALSSYLQRTGTTLLAADATGQAPDELPRFFSHVALVFGNEGAGLSSSVASAAAHRVGIPLRGGVESLNVAVAAGILLYELRNR